MRGFLFFLIIIAVSLSGADSDWPGWLGPNKDGWVKDFKAPKKWPERLNQVWQLKVGDGYGTPLVVGTRVYQHARIADEEVLWCVDLNTGKKAWRSSYKEPFEVGGGGETHGKGPKSNPAYADGRIFVMSITGTLSAWDASTGNLIWRKNYNSRFKPSYPRWGMCNSPVVDEGRVIAHFGNEQMGALKALDVKTGKEVWTQGADGPCYSSPILVEHEGIRQVIELNHRALVAVDSKTGTLLWEFSLPSIGMNQNTPTPSFVNGRVLLGAENRGLYSFEPKQKNGKWSVRMHWHHRKASLNMSTAVVNDGRLYGLSHLNRGRLFCADSETGEVFWEGPERAGRYATFLAFKGYVMVLFGEGELQVIVASPDGYQKAASWMISEEYTWAAPVLLKNGILIKDQGHLTFWSF